MEMLRTRFANEILRIRSLSLNPFGSRAFDLHDDLSSERFFAQPE